MAKRYTAQEMRHRADEEQYLWNDSTTAAMLRQAADDMEREEREKKYEFIVEYETMYGWRKLGFCTYNSVEDAKLFIRMSCAALQIPKRIRKREVGEWEEVLNEE